MNNLIGDEIYEYRISQGFTQDQFGVKYGVSGPAVFKFEKGYVKPSLELWLTMAKDFNIDEKKALLMWIKSRLPEKYQDLINIETTHIYEESEVYQRRKRGIDYSKFVDRKEMRKVLLKDNNLPKGLKSLIRDDEIWLIYKPTGAEINFLRDTFGKLGEGSKSSFREALRLIREFVGEE